jgi:hypothetical protein
MLSLHFRLCIRRKKGLDRIREWQPFPIQSRIVKGNSASSGYVDFGRRNFNLTSRYAWVLEQRRNLQRFFLKSATMKELAGAQRVKDDKEILRMAQINSVSRISTKKTSSKFDKTLLFLFIFKQIDWLTEKIHSGNSRAASEARLDTTLREDSKAKALKRQATVERYRAMIRKKEVDNI